MDVLVVMEAAVAAAVDDADATATAAVAAVAAATLLVYTRQHYWDHHTGSRSDGSHIFLTSQSVSTYTTSPEGCVD